MNDGINERLTYEELTSIIAGLAIRVQHLEEALMQFYKTASAQDDFLVSELLKTGAEMSKLKTHLPLKLRFTHKRLKELEDCLKGFITYYHTNNPLVDTVKIKPYTGIEL